MTKPLATALTITLSVTTLLAGCGGDSGTTTPSPQSVETTLTSEDLKRAVRQALRENDQLSGQVLWTNQVPLRATQSTRGPALASLRQAAADRRRRGIRVRTLANKLTITSVVLNPSYATATAAIRSVQQAQPYKGGKPLGRAVRLDERARVELHRLGTSSRFVVWRLRPAR